MILQAQEDNIMLLDYLLKKCSSRYKNHLNSKKYCSRECESICNHDCQRCLEDVHFSDRTITPNPRKYDCSNMADCYFCKYAFKYTSEIIYGLRCFKDIENLTELKVLSVGCGPCTDLTAIDKMKEDGEINFERIDYKGIDPLNNVWSNIWLDIQQYYDDQVSFYPCDVFDVINENGSSDWVPDLIVFQYVFSDMFKHSGEVATNEFINKIANFINSQNKTIYILCNDINLSKNINGNGGREFFDILGSKIKEPKIVERFYFKNQNRTSEFHYGNQYDDNSLIYNTGITDDYRRIFNPFESCSSAQIKIKKISS